MKNKLKFLFILIIFVFVVIDYLYAQSDRRKEEIPVATESVLILPDDFKDNYPYTIDVRFYVDGNYNDRQLITTIPLAIGEPARGRIDYDSSTGRMDLYINRTLVGTKRTKKWSEPLSELTYGYGVKFVPKETDKLDFRFTPQVFASSVDEYEVFRSYDTNLGTGIKIYHRRRK